MGRKLIRIVWFGTIILMVPDTARADATVLLGVMSAGGPRPAVGVAYSYCPSVAGFEIEYLSTLGGITAAHSNAGGVLASLIVHLPTISNVQFFAIGGLGIWGEKFADGKGGVSYAKGLGGGFKIRIAEHVGLRVDYRLFLLGHLEDGTRGPSTTHPQRLSAGLHLVF